MIIAIQIKSRTMHNMKETKRQKERKEYIQHAQAIGTIVWREQPTTKKEEEKKKEAEKKERNNRSQVWEYMCSCCECVLNTSSFFFLSLFWYVEFVYEKRGSLFSKPPHACKVIECYKMLSFHSTLCLGWCAENVSSRGCFTSFSGLLAFGTQLCTNRLLYRCMRTISFMSYVCIDAFFVYDDFNG